tara:strand:+ start:171 stop:803 length:633 start_codon:yes stop_codon:yes gene_type:complete
VAYAAQADWDARYPKLGDNLGGGILTEALSVASTTINKHLHTPLGHTLEPATHTNVRWRARRLPEHAASGRHLRVPDWPLVAQPDKWAYFNFDSLALYNGDYDLQETVTVGDIETGLAAYERGLIILPDTVSFDDGWWCLATYDAGYATAGGTADIPEVLVEAAALEARALVYGRLGQSAGNVVDAAGFREDAILSSRARDLLDPYVRRA